MSGVTHRRPTPTTRPANGTGGTLVALLVVATLLGACASPAPSPSPGQPTPLSSGPVEPTAPGTTPAPTPSPRADGWTPVSLPDLPQVATLEPVSAGTGAVATDTSFRLTSLDGRPPADMARSLVAEPALAFEVVSVQGATAIVRPAEGLVPRTTYRISLARADGTTEASWVARAAGPLQVTDTVPGDAATKVPRDTGIEVSFDQYGVTAADFARHFSIQPTVAGRFEPAGRTIAFVPDQPLAKGRLYTVTVRRGLPLTGTGEVLDADLVFRFETAAKAASPITARLLHPLVEASTHEKAALSIAFDVPEGRRAPRSIPITVHRVDGQADAVAAWKAISNAPEWTRVSAIEPVPTGGLKQVYSGTVRTLKLDEWDTRWFTVPVRLPAGWYVITERWAGIPRQALLQVSDIATFAMVATDRTAVWVNELGSGKTAAGAAVTLAGHELGRTDDRGLLVTATPADLTRPEPAADALLVVRYNGQTTFREVDVSGGSDGYDEYAAYDDYDVGSDYATGNDDWWRLLSTDRAAYRTTDTVNAWGMARNRDTGKVPSSVTLAIRSSGSDAVLPPVAIMTAKPDANGAFAARLEIRDLPVGEYGLELSAGGETIGETWLEVATLTKPAWQLAVDTTPHAVIAGGTVTAHLSARFFEGTPVAGTPISLSDDETDRALRTDALGEAEARIRVSAGSCDQECLPDIYASATLPEEADISATTEFRVFAASALVDADADLSGTRLRISGKVSDVVLSRFEQPGADLEDVDPRGAGRAGASVALHVVESWTVRVKVGTRYDAITKRVVPVYEDRDRSRTIADRTVTTTARGTYELGLDVRGGSRSYEITASYVDGAGRRTSTDAWVYEPGDADVDYPPEDAAALYNADSRPDSESYALGDTVRVRFVGEVAAPAVERYLFAIAQRGLKYVTVGTAPTFRTTFDASSLPSILITGVRFNGRGYEAAVSGYEASADLRDRELTVKVTPDRERYAPGDTASVSIRTLRPDGSPVSASVYVAAIDEKLYSIGAAYDADPLSELYASVGDGLLAVVTSHRTPADDAIECCDTMGGGDGADRTDFRDWLIATLVTTDAAGRATVPVPLSDDLTSWRVSASAVDGSLRAGSGTGLLAVGLPFFAEATIQPEYLEADRPIIRVRAMGTGLDTGDRVTFTVSSDTLPMRPITVGAAAFEAAEVPLPALSPGTHAVRITAKAGSGRSDTLVRTFRVVTSRAGQLSTTWAPLSGATKVEPSVGTAFTRLLLVDAGRGRVIPTLYDLAWGEGNRADEVLAVALANRVLANSFALAPGDALDEGGMDRFWLGDKGLALVPYGSARLDVTALAAMAGDPRVDAAGLRAALEKVAFDPKTRRDRRLLALAGLAGLGDPVLGEVRTAAQQADLSVEEQTALALAALFVGDEALAARLERAVLAAHGLAYGPWLRVDAGGGDADAVQTARMAIVAASLGDPVAADMDAWLVANPPRSTLVDLERALAARGWAGRIAGADAVAAVTIDGSRREVRIRSGEPASLELTPAQAATARLEPVSGSVLVVTSREAPLDPSSLTKPPGVSITRTVKPAGAIGSTDRVVVTLTVKLSRAARKEAWSVVEWAPSGLTPMGCYDCWDEGTSTTWTVPADRVDGQRLEYSFGGDAKVGEWRLRYVARVVTPGAYRWEPAVIQSSVSPDRGIVLAPTTVTIRGLER